MGSVKKKEEKQQKMFGEATGKEHKKRLHLRPKKTDTTEKSKFKRIKTKKKRKKDLVARSNVTESEMNENNENMQTENIETKATIKKRKKEEEEKSGNDVVVEKPTAAQQLRYFLHQYQSGNGIQLSALELESFRDECMVELSQGTDQSITSLGEHLKFAFGSSWKEVLCEKQLREGEVDPGNPAVLVISLSALRSLELLRELRPLTKECHAVKLFAKHMKIEEQVSFLKHRVNIACGTPNRIKKLIDMEALGLSRLAVIILDTYTDVKGYSLFTLPQIREEFWDLYKCYFHDGLLGGNLRICLYGRIPEVHAVRIEATDD